MKNNFMQQLQYNTFEKFLINFQCYFFYFLPLALISGPFLSDFFAIIISIIFIYLTLKKKIFYYYKNSFFLVFIFWSFYIILRSLFSIDPLFSLESSLFYFRFGFFALSIWYILETNINSMKIFTFFCFLAIFILCFDAIVQFFLGYNLIGIPYNNYRVSSFFGEELVLGSYISRIFPIFIALIYFNYDFFKKFNFIIIILATLVFVTTVLSAERIAIFNICIVIAILCFFHLKYKKYLLLFLSFLILIFYTIIQSSEAHYERLVTNTLYEQFYIPSNLDNSDKSKIYNLLLNLHIFSKVHEGHILTAYKIFLDNPLFGQGTKMFRKLCDKDRYVIYLDDVKTDSCSNHPHNTYIQLLSAIGIIGITPFVFFMFFILYQFLIVLKSAYISNIIKSRLIIYLIIGINFFPLLPSGSFFNNWLSVIYYLPIGIMLYFYYNSKIKCI